MDFDYKDHQQKYKHLYKQRGKNVWVSKEFGDIKGRTYVKKEQEVKDVEFKEKDTKKEKSE